MTRYYVFFIIAFTAINLTGCVGKTDKVLEDQFEVESTIRFYFKVGDNSFKVLPSEFVEDILVDAFWETPDGVTVLEKYLYLSEGLVTWNVGSHRYSCNGLKLNASCLVRVEKSAQSGKRKIRVILPGLTKVSGLLRAEPVVPRKNSGTADSRPNVFTVYTFNVHSSQISYYFTLVWKWALAGIIIVSVIVFILGGLNEP